MKTARLFIIALLLTGGLSAGVLRVATFPIRHPVKVLKAVTFPLRHPIKTIF